jgi:hypothetical protein
MKGLDKLSLCFASGCVGGFVTALLLYLCGALGLMSAYGVKMAPALSAEWLYTYTVWGGLFGLLFALPWLENMSWFLSMFIYAVVPALVFLFIIFPLFQNEGIMGIKLGGNTPYFVGLFSLVWAFFTALWLRLCD